MNKSVSHILWYPGHELLLKDIVRAENCHLFDSAGNRYLDLESGVWCLAIGHSNRRILEAIQKQSALICHTGFGYSSPVVEEAAREILSLLDLGDGRCVFLSSGSEAVEYGVRAIQSLNPKPLLMTMTDSYFGAYGSANKRQESEWFGFDWSGCNECKIDGDCNSSCGRWKEIPFQRIGGFLFEPGSSSGLVRFPPEKLIRNIAETIHKDRGFILVNEVTTGVGRTGKWFGYQHYPISPDVVILGKGIGNGYPVSAAVFREKIASALEAEPLKYSQSHQNDPLGAAASLEVIHAIQEEGLIERGREIADQLGHGLEAIKDLTPRMEIRSRGLMIAIEFKDDPDHSFTTRLHKELVHRGFITGRRPGFSVLRLDPSLTIGKQDIADFLSVLEDLLFDENQ